MEDSFPLKHRAKTRLLLSALQIAIGVAVVVLDVAAISYFMRWLSGTDWIMGHTQGDPSYIIAAHWTAGAGVLGTALWGIVAVCRRFMFPVRASQQRSRWQFVLPVLLAILMLPVGTVAAIAVTELPRARFQVQKRRIESGAATLPELVEGLKSPDYDMRVTSAEAIGKMGPPAKAAVPELAEALEDPSVYVAWAAAEALGMIGPDAEVAIPALLKAVRREGALPPGGPRIDHILPWHASEALARIGPAAIPALVGLLSDTDPRVRRRAATALGQMGSQAKDAVPALSRAAEDEDQDVRASARRALDRMKGT